MTRIQAFLERSSLGSAALASMLSMNTSRALAWRKADENEGGIKKNMAVTYIMIDRLCIMYVLYDLKRFFWIILRNYTNVIFDARLKD